MSFTVSGVKILPPPQDSELRAEPSAWWIPQGPTQLWVQFARVLGTQGYWWRGRAECSQTRNLAMPPQGTASVAALGKAEMARGWLRPLSRGLGLPGEFLAVKMYFSHKTLEAPYYLSTLMPGMVLVRPSLQVKAARASSFRAVRSLTGYRGQLSR